MDEGRFHQHHGGLLDTLRRERGDCPDVEELSALAGMASDPTAPVEDAVDDADNDAGLVRTQRRPIEEHLRLCPRCAREWELLGGLGEASGALDDESWAAARTELDGRSAPWREPQVAGAPGATDVSRPRAWRWTALAASLLTVLGAGWWWWMQRAESASSTSEVRGGVLLTEPAGRVPTVTRFTWSSNAPASLVYQIEIDVRGDNDDQPFRVLTDQPLFEPPPSLLRELGPGTRFRWRVVAFVEGETEGGSGGFGGADHELGASRWVDVEVAGDGARP